MNKILIALVLVVVMSGNTYSKQEDWRIFSSYEGNINAYFEANTIRIKDAEVFIWILHDSVIKKASMKSLYQIDCNYYRSIRLQAFIYDDNMGKGNATEATDDNEKFQYGVPGSGMQLLIKTVCKGYVNKNE